MTSNRKYDSIKDMLFEFWIVNNLNKYEINNGAGLPRKDLIDYLSNKKLQRLNYFWPKKEKFRNRINKILGDCIRGDDHCYIAEDEDGITLIVTKPGRQFISIWSLGFYEEFRRRRKRSTNILHERVIGGVVGVVGVALVWLFKTLFG